MKKKQKAVHKASSIIGSKYLSILENTCPNAWPLIKAPFHILHGNTEEIPIPSTPLLMSHAQMKDESITIVRGVVFKQKKKKKFVRGDRNIV